MTKRLLLISLIVALASLVSLFFGYPLNNIFVINGLTWLVLLTLAGIVQLNKLIKNVLLKVIVITVIVFFELWAIGFFLLVLAMGGF